MLLYAAQFRAPEAVAGHFGMARPADIRRLVARLVGFTKLLINVRAWIGPNGN